MRKLLRYSVLMAAVAVVLPDPAGAQVYPERVAVKAHAAVTYQRRAREDNRAEQTERTTKTFRLGSDGSLDLGNISGDITVTRGGGSDATVDIVKTARGRDAGDARAQLDLVTIDISERNGRAELKAHYPNDGQRRNINVSVAYNVTAPAGTRISASSISGTIKITDIKGEVSVNTISGDVHLTGATRVNSAHSISGTVDIADVKTDGSVEAGTVSGDVRLRHVAARRVSGGTISGEIQLEDIDADNVGGHTISGEITFIGTLARHGRYEFRTNSGEVRLTLAGNTGFEVDANSFSGDIRSDFAITTHGTMDSSGHRGPRRSLLRGTYGDGSAVIDITTFSGSIVIGKK